jgi:hypothetical protein
METTLNSSSPLFAGEKIDITLVSTITAHFHNDPDPDPNLPVTWRSAAAARLFYRANNSLDGGQSFIERSSIGLI